MELADRTAFGKPASFSEVLTLHPPSSTSKLQNFTSAYGGTDTKGVPPLPPCMMLTRVWLPDPHVRLHVTHPLQATSRLKKNALHFRVNYLIIMLAVTAVCMILSPGSLLVLGLLGLTWTYLFIVRQSPLVLGGRTFRWVRHAGGVLTAHAVDHCDALDHVCRTHALPTLLGTSSSPHCQIYGALCFVDITLPCLHASAHC